jgi:hypothetical protein
MYLFTIWATKGLCEFIEKNLTSWSKIDLGGHLKADAVIYGSSLGLGLFAVQKSGIFYTKVKNKAPKVDIIQVQSMDTAEENRVDGSLDHKWNLLKEIESNKNCLIKQTMYVKDCVPMDSIVKTGDVIVVKEYWDQKKSVLCKILLNESKMVTNIIANAWLNDYIRGKVT